MVKTARVVGSPNERYFSPSALAAGPDCQSCTCTTSGRRPETRSHSSARPEKKPKRWASEAPAYTGPASSRDSGCSSVTGSPSTVRANTRV